MTHQAFAITSGPSKYDLQNGLFCSNPRRPVVFNAACPVGTAFEVYVLAVHARDGSGESWDIEGVVGVVTAPPRREGRINFGTVPKQGLRVEIHFRTDNRQGDVNFYEPDGSFTLALLDQIVQRSNEERFGDGRSVRR